MQLQIYQRWKNVNEISVVSGVILLVYSTVSVTVPWEDFVTYLPPSLPSSSVQKSKRLFQRAHTRTIVQAYYIIIITIISQNGLSIQTSWSTWIHGWIAGKSLKGFYQGFTFLIKKICNAGLSFFYLFVIIFLLLSAKWKTISSFKSTENRNLGWHK